MTKKGLILLLFLIFTISGHTQYFQTGQDPASIRWRHINTSNFQIIYPEEFEVKAQKVAFILEKVYKYGSESSGIQPKKISVILHTQTVKTNGLVAIAPKRVEFYTTPDQTIYPQDWLEQLAIHEFTHVLQVNKVEQEIPFLIRLLLGQQITAATLGLLVPWWLIEGDAVVDETALSRFGRGRLPSFLMEHQSQVIEKGVYSYDKAYLGSYNDYVPNHYNLGYYLTGEGRKRYGEKIWDNVFNDLGTSHLTITPVKWSLKKQTGLTIKRLYEQIFDSLKNDWSERDKIFNENLQKEITQPAKTYTNYRFNYFMNNGKLFSYKTSYNTIPKFIEIGKDNKERVIFTPGTIFDESVSLTDNLLTWSEQVPDVRWTHSGRSLIHIFNINGYYHKKFYPEFKGFSPCISPDKKQLVLVEVDFQNNYYISVYNMESFQLITRYKTESNNFFISPKWITDKELATVVLTEKGKKIAIVNPFSKELRYLTDESLGEVKHILPAKGKLFFIGSYAGKDDLYVMNLNDNSVYLIYNSRFGVGYPAITKEKDKIVLSDYSSNGYSLIEIPYNQDLWIPVEQVEKGHYQLAEELAKQEKGILEFSDYQPDLAFYESRKYNKLLHLFHFHSWAPAYFDINSYDIQPGVTLMSQNMLGTAETTLGYEWDLEEEAGKYYANFTYKGWYPIFSAEFNVGKRASQYGEITKYYNNQNQVVKIDTVFKNYSWHETTLDLTTKLPLDLTRGKYFRLIQPEVTYQLSSISVNSSTPLGFPEGIGQSIAYRLYAHQILKQSYQDMYPDFGIIADMTYRHSPFGDFDYGDIFTFQSIGYFPGLLPNHGFRGYYGYQTRTKGIHSNYSDGIRYPRGWNTRDNTEMYSFSVDYKFPLFYPDWNFGSILYLKRLKASLFGDYAHQNGYIYQGQNIVDAFSRNISSFGIEFTGDMHFFRFYAPIDMGVRAAYLPELGSMHFNLLFSIDFNSL